jgi:hypothetical protein
MTPVERLICRYSTNAIFWMVVAIIFLGFAIPTTIISVLDMNFGGTASLWILAIGVVPTSIFGLYLGTKSLSREVRKR